MVSLVSGESDSGSVYKRRRTSGALTPVRQRKQTLISKLSDSGFEEDLSGSSPGRTDDDCPQRSDQQPSSWYFQYGDIGYQIQREQETQLYPCNSLARQPQLTAEARCKLVSWLIPVHKHFRLSFECCCLAVNIVDQFLASTPVAADCFQLLGVTALLLASKQVEVGSPWISHLLSFCCNAFTKEQLCNLECLILLRLDFRLSAPTLAFFLDYYTSCTGFGQPLTEEADRERFRLPISETKRHSQCSNFARKVCELSLADYAFNKYPPSLTASCALRLSTELLNTEQELVEHATVQSEEKHWEGFMDELCDRNYDPNLARECKENLKLLVLLNKETLEVMPTM